MDFGALPPEINSGRMYSGPGSASLSAAAVAWDALAADLYSAATAYGSTISALRCSWLGPSSTAMAEAATPYVTWLSTIAGLAVQAADHAQAAAAAYEAAFAATVPPPLIAENRSRLLLLVASNVLGQNTPAIATTEAEYDQMWAQDAAAMYGYAASCATASSLTPFLSPPATADPAAVAAQGAATTHTTSNSAGLHAQEVMSTGSQVIATVPQALRELAATPASTSGSTSPTSLSAAVSKLGSLVETPAKMAMHPLNFLNTALSLSKNVAAPAATVAAKAALAQGIGSGAHALGVTTGTATGAGVGRGVSIGALSVPPAWAAAPLARPVAVELLSAGWHSAPAESLSGAPTSLPFLPLTSSTGRGAGDAASRFELRPTVVSRTPAGG